MKSPRLKKKDSASILTKPILTSRSAFSTSSKTSRPQPVSFNIGRMIRYDTQKVRPTSTVSKILAKPSEYSSPSGIKDFIYIHTVEKTHYHSAVIIQRTWKRYKALKRLFRFLKFAHHLVFVENRFVFYTWFIRLTPPANIAKRIYANVTQYMADKSIKMKENMRLATFDEFMKTNCIFVRKNIDYEKIIRAIRILNYPTLRKILSLWSEYSVDQITVKKCNPKGNLLWKSRDKFNGEFIYFHFWRNYTNFKKNKKVNLALEAHMYIPEWAFYRSIQETKFRMKKAADDKRKFHLLNKAIYAIRENSLYESKLNIKFHNCVRIFMRSTMQLVVRALVNNAIFQKFDHGILKRLFRAWYHAIDKEIIKRNSIGAFKRRNELKIMSKIFIEWQKFSRQEMIRYLKLMTDARSNELRFTRVIYILQRDRIHYLLLEAYSRWKHIIEMAKKANRFTYWSINYSQQREFKKYVLDVFKENAGRPMKSKDIWPFKFETSKMYLNRNKRIGKNSKTAHFWRQIQKLIAKNEPIPFVYPSCTVSSCIYAYKNTENFPLYGNWAESATSYQVKALFYRFILLFTHSKKLIQQKSLGADLDQKLFDFREKYNLYQFSSLCELRDLLESEESERRLKRVYRNQRDYDQVMSLEAHDAAQVFHTNWPVHFSLNEEPRTIFSIESPMKSSDKLKIYKNYQEDKESPNLTESHPFLQPIDQIKSQIIANNRKYFRKPEEVFANHQKVLPSIITSQIPGRRKSTQKHEKIATGYENHVPIVLNPDITDMLVNEGEFKIQELRNLQDSAHKEVLKRQRTEDAKVINDSKKVRSRQKTINPKDITNLNFLSNNPPSSPMQSKPKESMISFPKLSNTPIKPIDSSNTKSSSPLPPPKNPALEKGIMFSKVSSSFLDNKSNFLNPQQKRIETIMKNFFEFLNFLIFGSKSAFERVDFELFHMRLIKIIGNLAEIAKKEKLKKKGKPKKKRTSKSPNPKSKPLIKQTSQKIETTAPENKEQPEPLKTPATPKKVIKKPKPLNSKSQLLKKTKKKLDESENETNEDSETKPKTGSGSKATTVSPQTKKNSPSRSKKGKKKNSPSNSPQEEQKPIDPNYFPFVKPSVNEEWIIDFFGKLALNDTSNISPFDHFLGGSILFQHLRVFLFIEGNTDEVIAHLKREIEWAPQLTEKINVLLNKFNVTSEKNKEEEEDNIQQSQNQEEVPPNRVVFQTVARIRGRPQRKTTFADFKEHNKEIDQINNEKVASGDDENKFKPLPRPKKIDDKQNEISLIQRKFTFATDMIGAIFSLSYFFSPYLQIIDANAEKTDTFSGVDELRALIRQRIVEKDSYIVIPEEIVCPPKTDANDDDYVDFYKTKFAATTEDLTPVIRKRRTSTVGLNRKQHRKTLNFNPGELNLDDSTENNSSTTPMQQAPFIVNKARPRGRRKSIRIFTPLKEVTDNNIELFLCLAPYVMPINLLIKMIKIESEKAKEIIMEQQKIKEKEEQQQVENKDNNENQI